jgi:hypothetical protein
MKKETRGRKKKIHQPVNASFDEVLGAIAGSKYKDEKKLLVKKKKQ